MMKNLPMLLLLLHLLANKTEAQDGPYFQQWVDYRVDLRLDDSLHSLSGHISMVYHNNSPHTLDYIWIHLWPNAYKNNETALGRQLSGQPGMMFMENPFPFAPKKDRGYIDSLVFKGDGQLLEWEYHPEHIDIARVKLNKALQPGQSVELSTPFYLKIPKSGFSRLGHSGQAYQITQWYPKPAVYDRDGWHPMPYLNQGEFYSEFGSFDVSITLPANYRVASTGYLQSPEEIAWRDSLVSVPIADSIYDMYESPMPPSAERLKTIRIVADSVHDFAWFADKRFIIREEVKTPDNGHPVACRIFFLPHNAAYWHVEDQYQVYTVLDDVKGGVGFYSKKVGPYPYRHCTAVDCDLEAGAGMEYPMITNVADVMGAGLQNVIVHEVGHNWFYGILGFNERDHPWMDEGINTFYELRYFNMPEHINTEDFSSLQYYLMMARNRHDQPIDRHSEKLSGNNYGLVYYKTAYALMQLMGYMGQAPFDSMMQAFYEEWKFKHPGPEDFRRHVRAFTGKDLDWFFEDMLSTTKQMDYKLVKYEDGKVLVRNVGDIAAPFPIELYNEQIQDTLYTRWYEGFVGEKWLALPPNETGLGIDIIYLDYFEQCIEIDRDNNRLYLDRLCPRMPDISATVNILDKPYTKELYFLPAWAWNEYNKNMLGALFYNSILPPRPLNWRLMPMYSFGTDGLAYMSDASYSMHPQAWNIRQVQLQASARQFALAPTQTKLYQRYRLGLQASFRPTGDYFSIDQKVNIEGLAATDMLEQYFGSGGYLNYYQRASYVIEDHRLKNPWGAQAGVQRGEDFLRWALEAEYLLGYFKSGKGLHVRLFWGAFSYNQSNNVQYNLPLSGTSPGPFNADYAYDQLFFQRMHGPGQNHSFFAHQFLDNYGAFASYTLYSSHQWLSALSLKADLPIDLPLGLFANLGSMAGLEDYPDAGQVEAEAGVYLPLFRDIIVIYAPFAYTPGIKQQMDMHTDKYIEHVRFVLKLTALDPIYFIDEAIF